MASQALPDSTISSPNSTPGPIFYDINKQSKMFIQRFASIENDQAIIYTPHCHKLEYPLSKKEIFGIFDSIAELQKFGIVHRDLSPNHFMKHPTNGAVVLIDFGCAHFIDLNPKLDTSNHDTTPFYSFNGSIEFAAHSILEHLSDFR